MSYAQLNYLGQQLDIKIVKDLCTWEGLVYSNNTLVFTYKVMPGTTTNPSPVYSAYAV